MKIKKNINRLMVSFLFLILSSLSFASQPQPIIFALSLSLTGINQDVGLPMKNGLLLWKQQVNDNGGILGRPIDILFSDDQSEAQRAAEIYQGYVDDGKVDFFFSPYTSKLTAVVAPITEAANIPLITTGANSEELWNKNYKYLFGLLKVSTNFASDMIEILALAGHNKIAIISSNEPYGRSVAKGSQIWAESIGVEVVINEKLNDNTDATSLLQSIAQSQASAIICSTPLLQAIKIRRTMAKQNITGITFFSSSSRAASQDYQAPLGPLSEHTIAPIWWGNGVEHNRSGVLSFKQAYQAMFNIPASDKAALSYAAGEIYQQSITSAKSTSPEKVRQALLNMNTMTIIGRFALNRSGKQLKHQIYLTQWQNGQLEIVWPKALSTRKIILEE